VRITKRQLFGLLKELHPRDVADAEYDQQLQDLAGMYSDMHKELYRRRPRGPMFKTVEEAEAAVDELWDIYAEKNREREAREKEKLEFIEMERRKQELMPGEYDIELPMRSGMGRRMENKMRITKNQLKRIIRHEHRIIMSEDREPLKDILDHEDPADVVHVMHLAMDGGEKGGPEAENLVMPIDHAKAVGGEPVIRAPEMLPAAPPVLSNEATDRIQVYRGRDDAGKSYRLPRIVYELYYDACVSGDASSAINLIEEHLDSRFPGWQDYEWRSN